MAKVGQNSIIQARMSTALKSLEAQDTGINSVCAPLRPHKHLLYNLQGDGTRMTVSAANKPIAVHEVFTQHGLLIWEDDSRVKHREEVIIPPCVLDETTADGILGGVQQKQPHLGRLLSSAEWAALV